MKKTKWNTIHDKTYKAIMKFFKDNPHLFKDVKEVKFENVTEISYELESKSIISFGLHSRSDGNGTDYWTQIEYASEAIGKTIIYNYDFDDCFENLKEFADNLASMEAYIQEFESRLSIKQEKNWLDIAKEKDIKSLNKIKI